MLEDITGGRPPMIRQIEVPPLPPGQERVPEHPVVPLDPKHIQAVDALFTQTDESQTVAGLLGFWFGAPAVIDMMHEQFFETDEEEEEKPERNGETDKPV